MWKSPRILEKKKGVKTRVGVYSVPFHGGFLINKNNHRHPLGIRIRNIAFVSFPTALRESERIVFSLFVTSSSLFLLYCHVKMSQVSSSNEYKETFQFYFRDHPLHIKFLFFLWNFFFFQFFFSLPLILFIHRIAAIMHFNDIK